MGDAAQVCVQAAEAVFAEQAREFGESLGLKVVEAGKPAQMDLVLEVAAAGLRLRVGRSEDADLRRSKAVRVDWLAMDTQSGPGRSLQQPLAKAAGLRKGEGDRPRVLDATGGFGEDAWLLASWGCEVLLIERNPVMGALLADGLARAKRVRPEVAERIRLVVGDAVEVLAQLECGELSKFAEPEVVCVDPMFPAGRKTVERKAMRVLRMLVGEDGDGEGLVAAAMKVAKRRVVVKRPARAAALGGWTPVSSHRGRGYRFDVYPTAGGTV